MKTVDKILEYISEYIDDCERDYDPKKIQPDGHFDSPGDIYGHGYDTGELDALYKIKTFIRGELDD